MRIRQTIGSILDSVAPGASRPLRVALVALVAAAIAAVVLIPAAVAMLRPLAREAGSRQARASLERDSRVTTSATGLTAGSGASAEDAAPAEASDPGAPPRTEFIGFYINWDDSSYRSLSQNIDQLTAVMPMWYHVGNDGRVWKDDAAKQERAMELIRSRRPDLPVMPIVNGFDKKTGSSNPDRIAKLISRPAGRKALASRIVRAMRQGGFEGVNMDFEGLPPSARGDMTAFQKELYRQAKAGGLTVSQDVVVAGAAFDLEQLGKHNDFVIPMMYDEHWKSSPAGPISSQGWYESTLKNKVFTKIPPEKVVVALGAWTYDWPSDKERAESYTYPEATAVARRARKTIKLDADSLNPRFSFKKGKVTHRFWMLDAVTMFNQIKTAAPAGVRGYAVWRLGAEDPAIWRMLPKRDRLDEGAARSLQSTGRTIEYDTGRGLITGQTLEP